MSELQLPSGNITSMACPPPSSLTMMSSPVENAPALFAGMTRPNQERKTRDRLKDRGFRVMVPTFVERCYSRKRSSRDIVRFVFPSYFFIQFAFSFEAWREIHETKGVAHLIGQRQVLRERGGNLPMVIPTALAERDATELLSMLDADDRMDVQLAEALPEDPTGLTLRAKNGPFTSFAGVCAMRYEQRLQLLLNVFGRMTPVWFDRADVELQHA